MKGVVDGRDMGEDGKGNNIWGQDMSKSRIMWDEGKSTLYMDLLTSFKRLRPSYSIGYC